MGPSPPGLGSTHPTSTGCPTHLSDVAAAKGHHAVHDAGVCLALQAGLGLVLLQGEGHVHRHAAPAVPAGGSMPGGVSAGTQPQPQLQPWGWSMSQCEWITV